MNSIIISSLASFIMNEIFIFNGVVAIFQIIGLFLLLLSMFCLFTAHIELKGYYTAYIEIFKGQPLITSVLPTLNLPKKRRAYKVVY
jgi:hypothetical protein